MLHVYVSDGRYTPQTAGPDEAEGEQKLLERPGRERAAWEMFARSFDSIRPS